MRAAPVYFINTISRIPIRPYLQGTDPNFNVSLTQKHFIVPSVWVMLGLEGSSHALLREQKTYKNMMWVGCRIPQLQLFSSAFYLFRVPSSSSLLNPPNLPSKLQPKCVSSPSSLSSLVVLWLWPPPLPPTLLPSVISTFP